MSKSSILVFLFLVLTSVYNSADGQQDSISSRVLLEKNYQEVKFEIIGFTTIEKFAMYPNGEAGLTAHMMNTLKYPRKAKKAGIEGVVVVSFVVDIDGYVKNITIVNSANPILDKEAARIISKMERWVPAIQRGSYVKSAYQQSIEFIIE